MTATVTLAGLLDDARALLRRGRGLIASVAAPFLFLPTLAVQLLTPPPPPLPAERTQATLAPWLDALAAWGRANGGWYLLADAIALYGVATLAVLLLDRGRPTVGEALARAVRVWPRFVLAGVLAAVPIGLGMWLILPGLFFQARFVAAGAALVREQPLSAAGALARSWRLTGRATLPLFAAVALLLAVQWVVLGPIVQFDVYLRQPAHLNPFVLALVDAAMAAAGAAYQVAGLLLGIAAYRRLAS